MGLPPGGGYIGELDSALTALALQSETWRFYKCRASQSGTRTILWQKQGGRPGREARADDREAPKG